MSVKQYHIFPLCTLSLLLSFPCQTQQFRNPSNLLIPNTTCNLPHAAMTSSLLHSLCCMPRSSSLLGRRLEPCGDLICTHLLFEGFGVFHPLIFPSSSVSQLCQTAMWESHTPRAPHSAFNFCAFRFLCIAGF